MENETPNPMSVMEQVSMQEVWMLLGEKDVQIYQLLKTVEKLQKELVHRDPPRPKGL